MVLQYNCKENDRGRNVYSILRDELHISASLVKRLKKSSGIFVNGIPKYTIHLLQEGDIVTADVLSAEPPSDIVPETGEIDILYENEGMLAVNKPAGIIVHPSHAKYTGTLSNYVAGYLLKNSNAAFCHTVNRLDRDTSGVVLFAKNSYMKARMLMNMPKATKEYLALIYGEMPKQEGTIHYPIRRFEEGNMLRIISHDGQTAITHYQVEKTAKIQNSVVSLLRLRLETGRTHQIRVHQKAMGCPILGDGLYFSPQSKDFSQKLGIINQTLHAESVTFIEPLLNQEITITANIKRNDMQMILDRMQI